MPPRQRQVPSFVAELKESTFKTVIRESFKAWASTILPESKVSRYDTGSDTQSKPMIWFREDGYPNLPIIDEDSVTPNVVRELLTDLISKTWDFAMRDRPQFQSTPIPWAEMVLPTRGNYMRPVPLSQPRHYYLLSDGESDLIHEWVRMVASDVMAAPPSSRIRG
ncbi:hypothetical protein BDN70DRAFT_926163 [Pholiota conissans]|uniref:Uncharacterized protein n=1 Tax=Pholiota conissans TaxID=109636 RepID=A0A9P5YPN1_9AGAR|nr:hypothetical protein BDN70DRAFT_926163 [Pholiota conissans]